MEGCTTVGVRESARESYNPARVTYTVDMGSTPREIKNDTTVTVFESDGCIVARDEESGIASQGETKAEALMNLADAIELHSRPEADEEEVEEADAPWF